MLTASLKKLNKSTPIESMLPKYGKNVTSDIIALDDGRLMSTIILDGIPFESESDGVLKNSFLSVNSFLAAMGKDSGGKLAIWTHIIKKRVFLNDDYIFDNPFVQAFSDQYCKSFSKNNFYKTIYYITFVLKYDDVQDGIEELESINSSALTVLNKFNANMLSVVDLNDDVFVCENTSFLSYLLNNEEISIPLSNNSAIETIGNSDWFFGYDLLELRNKESLKQKYAVFYALKDYPATTESGMWDFLLSIPQEFVLSQSFVYAYSAKAMKEIDQQINKLTSVNDAATHQIEELELGRAYLSSGEICFGEYQASLVVFGDTPKRAIENGVKVSGEFLTAGKGTRWVKSNLDALFTFLSIMPASKYRPLAAAHTSTNLSCGFSLHNFSMGKKSGNPIGDGTAIMPLKTRSDGLYHFNTHYSNPLQNVVGQMIAGHAMFLGATGTGKTTLEGTLCAYLQRFNPMMFVIDYNRSTELFVRAFGGSYFAIEDGVSTGLNPFQVEENPSPALMSFLYRLVERCSADENGNITVFDETAIKLAVDAVMNLPVLQRRFSILLQSISQGTALRARLSKWCESESGKFAWALDAPINTFNPKDYAKVGFDSTAILKEGNAVTEPLLATLFFYKELMQREGRLMLTIVEEFWMPCNFPLTQDFIKSILKAGRLKGEFIWLVSQSPEDAVECAIFAALVQQTPTKVMLPNPDAQKEAYLKCGLTVKEFEELSKLDKECRIFLVKQSNSSCFAKMDLGDGFDDFLPIISGSTETILLCSEIRKRLNSDDPNLWIPELQRILREKKKAKKNEL